MKTLKQNKEILNKVHKELEIEKFRTTTILDKVKNFSLFVKSVMTFELCKNFKGDVEKVKNRIGTFFNLQ